MGLLRLEQSFAFTGIRLTNKVVINGTTYGTGYGGRKLYCLINPEQSHFYGETTLIDEDFKVPTGKNAKAEIKKLVAKLKTRR